MEEKENYIFGIALNDNDDEIDESYIRRIKKEYDLTDKDIKELKMAHLFNLAKNIEYITFDADIILFSYDKETYYHTSDFEPINRVKNEDIIALVDENCSCKIIR